MLNSNRILQDLIDAKPGDPGPFVKALAAGISRAMPEAQRKIPFTAEGVAFLKSSVDEALALFLAIEAEGKLAGV